jgi:hypothetical protein
MKRGSRRALVAALSLCALCAWPVVARAQSAADKETARAQFDLGKSRRDRADFAGALEAFKASDAIMNVPTTKLAVARAYASLGQLVEARDAALQVDLMPKAAKEPAPFTNARAAAARLASELAERIPSLTIVLANPNNTSTQDVVVAIDGTVIPAAALSAPRRANPGSHVITATRGEAVVRNVTELAEKQTASVTLDLSAIDPMLADPIATTAPRPEAEGPRSPLLWIGLGVAVVGVGVGVTAGLLSAGHKNDVDVMCRDGKCPPAAYDALDGARQWATISTIGFIGAGAGAALAGVGLLLGRSQSAPVTGKATVVPSISATSVGVAGTF